MKGSVRKSSSPDHPNCANKFFRHCSCTAWGAGSRKGRWVDSTQDLKAYKNISERRCQKGIYQYSPGATPETMSKGTGTGARKHSNKKADISKPGNEETEKYKNCRKSEKMFDDKRPSFCLVWSRNKRCSTRRFRLSGRETKRFRCNTATRNWNYSSHMCLHSCKHPWYGKAIMGRHLHSGRYEVL